MIETTGIVNGSGFIGEMRRPGLIYLPQTIDFKTRFVGFRPPLASNSLCKSIVWPGDWIDCRRLMWLGFSARSTISLRVVSPDG